MGLLGEGRYIETAILRCRPLTAENMAAFLAVRSERGARRGGEAGQARRPLKIISSVISSPINQRAEGFAWAHCQGLFAGSFQAELCAGQVLPSFPFP